jgi:hypothetical protein
MVIDMSNIHNHAMMEFRAAKWVDENGEYCDEMQEAICKHVLKLLDVFADEGHSGSSAPYTVDLFKKLAMFEPVVPLTGEDWEWLDHGYCMQNKRCSHVFKQADRFDGQAYDIDGKIFWEWAVYEGETFKSHFTSGESQVPITFPYTPKREYVFRPTKDFPNEVL